MVEYKQYYTSETGPKEKSTSGTIVVKGGSSGTVSSSGKSKTKGKERTFTQPSGKTKVVSIEDEPVEVNEQLPTTPEETVGVFTGERRFVQPSPPSVQQQEEEIEPATYRREQVIDLLSPGSGFLPAFVQQTQQQRQLEQQQP